MTSQSETWPRWACNASDPRGVPFGSDFKPETPANPSYCSHQIQQLFKLVNRYPKDKISDVYWLKTAQGTER